MKNSKTVFYTQLIIWISTIALLFCPCPSMADGQSLWASNGVGLSAPDTYPPRVIPDGNGGAIIVGTYTYDLNPTTYYADVLAFRIDYSGTIIWSRNFGTSAHAPAITSNGSGGAIIAWLDGKQDTGGYKILVQNLDASTGNPQWNSGNPVQVSSSFGDFSSAGAYMYPKICLDNAGGAFIGWRARLAYINSTGTIPSPGIDGIELIPSPKTESSFEMISDGTGGPCFIPGTGWTMCPGGVYAAWNDTTTAALTVQRVKNGKQWGSAGTAISSTSGISYNLSLDGTSGFIISWLDSAVNPQLRAQKIDTSGNPQWTAGGVVVVDSAVIGGVISELSITTDGSSGAIIAWIDHRNADRDAYAQRLNAGGLPQWTANGVLLPPYIVGQTAPGDQANVRIVSDSIGGAVVTYQDLGGWSWDISATRLNQSGTKLWSNFIYADCYLNNPPCYNQVSPAIAFDASGPDPKGAIIAWKGSLAGQKVMVDTSPLAENIRALVREYYLDILDREPDQGGWDYWSSEITRIMSLGIYVGEGFQAEARLFFSCQEYQDKGKSDNAFVTDLYQTFLQREPDAGGLAYWTGQLSAGLTRAMLITTFAYCDEFKAYMTTQFGTDTTRPENNMVNDFYRGFLNRFPDDGGFNSWLTQMRQAQCTGQAAVRDLSYQLSSLFVNSGEYAGRNRNNAQYTEDLYNAILKRGADPAGYLAWVNNLNTMSRQQVLQAFTSSTEFQTRVDAVIAAGCLP